MFLQLSRLHTWPQISWNSSEYHSTCPLWGYHRPFPTKTTVGLQRIGYAQLGSICTEKPSSNPRSFVCTLTFSSVFVYKCSCGLLLIMPTQCWSDYPYHWSWLSQNLWKAAVIPPSPPDLPSPTPHIPFKCSQLVFVMLQVCVGSGTWLWVIIPYTF